MFNFLAFFVIFRVGKSTSANVIYYWVASMANPVGICVGFFFTGLPMANPSESVFNFVGFLLGCLWETQSESVFNFVGFYWVAYGKPSRNLCLISWLFLLFSVSVKVLPVTPLLSGGFVHRAFCAYFLRIERVVGNA